MPQKNRDELSQYLSPQLLQDAQALATSWQPGKLLTVPSQKNMSKVSKPKKQLMEARQSKSNNTRNITCTNDCVNGNCVRTFPDGRQERWQAPMTIDPFTQQMGWDTTTNACGIY